jgi:hypothetical protein
VNGVKTNNNNSKSTGQNKPNVAKKSLSSAPVAQLCGCGKEKKDETQNDKNPFIPKQTFWSPIDTIQAKFISGVKQLKSSPNFPPIQLKKATNIQVAQLAPFDYSDKEKPMLSVDTLSENIGINDKKKENKGAFKYADSEKKEETVKNISKNYLKLM